jgi:hypothetical protein
MGIAGVSGTGFPWLPLRAVGKKANHFFITGKPRHAAAF